MDRSIVESTCSCDQPRIIISNVCTTVAALVQANALVMSDFTPSHKYCDARVQLEGKSCVDAAGEEREGKSYFIAAVQGESREQVPTVKISGSSKEKVFSTQ